MPPPPSLPPTHIRAYMDNLFGATTNINSSGEVVKKLDILSNDTLVKFLCESGELCLAASEEVCARVRVCV